MGLNPTNKGGSTVVGNKPWTLQDSHGTYSVGLTTIDAMAAHEQGLTQLLVAKIDIEGSEGHAIEGAMKLFANTPPCMLMIELNSDWLQRAGTPLNSVVLRLHDVGYDTSSINMSEEIATYFLKQQDMP